MKSLFRFLVLIACAWPVLCAAESAQLLGQKIADLQKKYHIAGLSVAAVRNGAIVWHTNLGFADVERKVPVKDDTKFRIASISKTVTATALMQLWEQGKFKLDDNISDYLGYPVVNPHHTNIPITFRHLLTHTASFADGAVYDDFLMLTYNDPLNAPGLKELLSAGGKYYKDGAIYSTNAPGTKYSYSNLAFGLLGTLVEKISGERFDKYCEQRILQPLGMSASFNPADLPDIDKLAVLYRPGANGWNAQSDHYKGVAPTNRIGDGYKIGHNAIPCAPQGGLRAGAIDLVKFMRVFAIPSYGESRGILKKSTIELMLGTDKGDSAGGQQSKSLTFSRTTNLVEGETWIGHTGSAYGLYSMMFFQEKGPHGFVLLTSGANAERGGGGFNSMEREIFGAVWNYLQEPDEARRRSAK